VHHCWCISGAQFLCSEVIDMPVIKRILFAILMILAAGAVFYALAWGVFDIWIAHFGGRATVRYAPRAVAMLALTVVACWGGYRFACIAFRTKSKT
jgi:hypothetical protein